MTHARVAVRRRSLADRLSRALATAAAVALVAVPLLVVSGPTQGASAAVAPQAATSGSSATVNGEGDFANIAVTVDQTGDLVNQVVRVSWSGATPTLKAASGVALGNYMQLMQCWAEPGQQPTREQCQYGGFVDVPDGAGNIASRQMTGRLVDPNETVYVNPPNDFILKFVNFQGVDGTVETTRRSQFFDGATTNEVPIGRTAPNGIGEVFFEMQTGLEAPGLGCGQVIAGATPDCFLAVVPRSLKEVDGTVVGSRNDDWLSTSPLSTSNWANRLVFPLGFRPIGQACSFGRPETSTYGSDFVTEAITSWQPSLCGLGPRNYGFTSLSDDATRLQIGSEDPGLAFVNRSSPSSAGVTYAPVSVSAMTIVANVDIPMPVLDPDGKPVSPEVIPDAIKANVGNRFNAVKLNPRLVAKLLTQSYVFDVANGTASDVAGNPFDLSRDPEFLELNPDFVPGGYSIRITNGLGRMLVNAGLSDSAELLWRYVLADQKAKSFLAGKADPWGMKLNEFYRGLTLPTNSFPRADLGCRLPFTVPEGFTLENCTLDVYPYSNSFSGAARQVSRGETGRRDVPRVNQIQTFGLQAPQILGLRSMLALSDSASAARYRQVTVELQNAAGAFVGPTREGMAAAVAAMDPDAQGVLVGAPAVRVAGAYPLTLVTYAATVPAKLTAAQRTDYAKLLAYAATDGQVPGPLAGQLPGGYLPLPDELKAKTVAAAAQLQNYVAPTATPTVAPPPTPTPTPTGETFVPETPAPVETGDGGGIVPETGGASQTPLASGPAPTASPDTIPVAAAGITPADPASASRLALLAALVLGTSALLVRTVLPWVASRRT